MGGGDYFAHRQKIVRLGPIVLADRKELPPKANQIKGTPLRLGVPTVFTAAAKI